jgi:20S proteasome alpha/beta subunit
MDETSVQKISLLTDNIGVVYSGMGPGTQFNLWLLILFVTLPLQIVES